MHVQLLATLLSVAAPAPEQTADPEIAAILRQSALFSSAYVAEDIDTLLSIYAEDGVAAPGGRDFIRGREALRRYWQVPDGVDVVRHRAEPEEIVVEGRFAYDWGYYSGAMLRGGETRPFDGKYLIVWRKDADGAWRMVHDMWSGVPAKAGASE